MERRRFLLFRWSSSASTSTGSSASGPRPVVERPQLTAEQLEAVRERNRPILLSAAAGSGKTSVLVERFVQAVCEDGLAPGVRARDHLHRASGRRASLRACASACSSSAGARRRGTRRLPSSAPSTASARACCAPIRFPQDSTPISPSSTRRAPPGCAAAPTKTPSPGSSRAARTPSTCWRRTASTKPARSSSISSPSCAAAGSAARGCRRRRRPATGAATRPTRSPRSRSSTACWRLSAGATRL